jgi:hypothetical protein
MHMQMLVTAVVVAGLYAVASPGQAGGNGEISGLMRDRGGGALPGVRIRLTAGDDQRSAITDVYGRFVLRGLRLGTYQIVAELEGFRPASGGITLTAASREAHLAWRMEIGCLIEYQRVIPAARDAASRADAIVHVRVVSADGAVLVSDRAECDPVAMPAYTVQVLKAIHVRRGVDANQTTWRIFRLPEEPRLQPGAEYLALVGADGRAEYGLVAPVVDDRVASPLGGELNGVRLPDALVQLEGWARASRR